MSSSSDVSHAAVEETKHVAHSDYEDPFKDGYSGTTVYIWDQAYCDACAYPVKVNHDNTWMTIDTTNDPKDDRGVIGFPTPHGEEVLITIRGRQVKVVTDHINHAQALYVDGEYRWGHHRPKEKEKETIDLNKERKATLEPRSITFEYQGPQSGKMDDIIMRGKIVLLDTKQVYYYEEIMKDVLQNPTPGQQKLLDLLADAI